MDQKTMWLVAVIVVVVVIGILYFTYAGTSGTPPVTVISTLPSTVSTSVQSTMPTTLSTTTVNATTPAFTIKLAYSAKTGLYLVNATGYTLYLDTQDTPTSSSCYGQCAYYWHPFYISSIVVPSNFTQSDFGIITRTDGAQQLTYKGYPLYTYTLDTAPGNQTGNGVAGIFFAVTYPNIST